MLLLSFLFVRKTIIEYVFKYFAIQCCFVCNKNGNNVSRRIGENLHNLSATSSKIINSLSVSWFWINIYDNGSVEFRDFVIFLETCGIPRQFSLSLPLSLFPEIEYGLWLSKYAAGMIITSFFPCLIFIGCYESP